MSKLWLGSFCVFQYQCFKRGLTIAWLGADARYGEFYFRFEDKWCSVVRKNFTIYWSWCNHVRLFPLSAAPLRQFLGLSVLVCSWSSPDAVGGLAFVFTFSPFLCEKHSIPSCVNGFGSSCRLSSITIMCYDTESEMPAFFSKIVKRIMVFGT